MPPRFDSKSPSKKIQCSASDYALRILKKKACSTKRLRKKLQEHFCASEIDEAIIFCEENNLLNDQDLISCTALAQIQRKPHSQVQLKKRLYSYDFESDAVSFACSFVEEWYDTLPDKLDTVIGGLLLQSYFTEKNLEELQELSVWQTLTLSALVIIQNTQNCDEQTALRRLCLRGYSRSHARTAWQLWQDQQ